MADCNDISLALARLEKKIDACCGDRVTRADVEKIAKEAVKNSPAIASIAGGLTGIVASNTSGGMIALKGQFQNMRAEQMALDVEKKRLEAQILALQGRMGRVEAQVGLAKAQAGTALARSGQALSKAGNAVARVAGIVGAVTGVASILSQVKILIPQLNAAEARITTLEVRELQSFQKAIAANETALQAKTVALKADQNASAANLAANLARITAQKALALATRAKDIADFALNQANGAVGTAKVAKDLAAKAVQAASEAMRQIPIIRSVAVDAKTTAVRAEGKADSALQQIPPVRAIANSASAKADNANAKSDSALQQIPPVRAIANSASAKADNANAKSDSALQQIPPVRAIANSASAKADNANAKSDSALKQIPQVRAIALSAASGAAAAQAAAAEAKNYAIARMQRFGDAIAKVRTFEAETVPRIVRKVEQNTSQSRQAETKATNAQKTAWQTVSIVNIANDKLEEVSRQVYTTTGTVSAKDPAIVQIKNEIKRVETKTVNKDELKTAITESIKPDMFSDAVKVGVAASLPLLISASQKGLQQSLPAIEAAAAAGTCRTTQPGGCTTRALDSLGDRMGSKFDKALDAYNTGANTAQLAILAPMQRTLNQVNANTTGLRALITNGFAKVDNLRQLVTDKFGALYNALGIDRLVQMMNLAASLHNAAMLSTSLKDTLLEATSNLLAVTGLAKDAEGNPLDLNALLGKQLEEFIKGIVGAETYNNSKELWIKSNRIIQAASTLLWAVQGLVHTAISGVEICAGWIAKIGNGMKDEGLFNSNIFPWMDTSPNFKDPTLKFRERVDNMEEAAQQANQFFQTGLEFQQSVGEMQKNTTELIKALDDFDKNETTKDAAKEAASTPQAITKTDLLPAEA